MYWVGLFLLLCNISCSDDTLSPDAIVCLDACFMQKRNKGERDPPCTHPKSVFIPEVDMVRMENHWDDVCSSRLANSRPSCCA
jgi:hypothetical protein